MAIVFRDVLADGGNQRAAVLRFALAGGKDILQHVVQRVAEFVDGGGQIDALEEFKLAGV